MKALNISNEAVTRVGLLKRAETAPGAWMGIRIAAILLILDGWSSTKVAKLFSVTRWSVVQWIQRVNEEGLAGLEEKSRPGRPTRMDGDLLKVLEEALQNDPRKYGLNRNRWDGIVVVEYLKKHHRVQMEVRQAQRWIRRLGFSLRRPIYRFVQATQEGIDEFHTAIKKTPPNPKK